MNGEENGSYYNGVYMRIIIGYIVGLYRDNGKENGSYYLRFRVNLHEDAGIARVTTVHENF